MRRIKYNFDNEPNWENINLESSAQLKEEEGDLQGAIQDYSLAITNDPRDYFLIFERGKIFFKLKKYQKAINDLNLFIKENLDNPYGNHFEALFLKECCDLILKNPFQSIQDRGYLNLRELKDSDSRLPLQAYILFLNSLKASLKGDFEKSIDELQILNNLNPDFLKYQKYLLEHLPQEMNPILDLYWHIIWR